jgi:pyridoxamine 5'-phosphate oxidase-like protein
MSRRDQIKMSDEEVRAFLGEERTVICATNGRRGWPHLMPLWYVVRPTGDGGAPEVWAWTFAKSQKVRNLERDARATLQVEAGDSYEQLRGVMFECDVVVHRDVEDITAFGLELFERYGGVNDDVRAMVDAQAPKRVALQFVERSRATWDHRKLGGVY